MIVAVAANAREWSAFEVQEWAVDILPKPVIEALDGLSGKELADVVTDPSLLNDLELKALHVRRLQNVLAELSFH